MNLLDFILLIPIVLAGLRGFQRGFLKQIAGIIGLVLAVYITFTYMNAFSHLFVAAFNTSSTYAPFASALTLFIGTVLFVQATAYLIGTLLKVTALSIPNRILGMLFSTLQATLILSGTLLILSGFGYPDRVLKSDSKTYQPIITFAPTAYNTVALIIPGASSFQESVKKSIKSYSNHELFNSLSPKNEVPSN